MPMRSQVLKESRQYSQVAQHIPRFLLGWCLEAMKSLMTTSLVTLFENIPVAFTCF